MKYNTGWEHPVVPIPFFVTEFKFSDLEMLPRRL